MVVIFAMGIGLFAPPFGVGYYGACAISKINPDAGLSTSGGYMLALLLGLLPWSPPCRGSRPASSNSDRH